jgi:hypothetical protein
MNWDTLLVQRARMQDRERWVARRQIVAWALVACEKPDRWPGKLLCRVGCRLVAWGAWLQRLGSDPDEMAHELQPSHR